MVDAVLLAIRETDGPVWVCPDTDDDELIATCGLWQSWGIDCYLCAPEPAEIEEAMRDDCESSCAPSHVIVLDRARRN